MKIKLIIVDSFDAEYPNEEVTYYNDGDFIDRWVYSPEGCERKIETVFSEGELTKEAI